ncbi:MAG TPA: hypothetical protein VJ738_17685 [Steroidobacteraceae bacterium]|nr:hypothetical protein [Steroidobacteraceae bacterium]
MSSPVEAARVRRLLQANEYTPDLTDGQSRLVIDERSIFVLAFAMTGAISVMWRRDHAATRTTYRQSAGNCPGAERPINPGKYVAKLKSWLGIVSME